jgi:hypothetical protein
VYTFLEELTGSRAPSDEAKALACQAAEHQFAGMSIYVGGKGGWLWKYNQTEDHVFSLSLKLALPSSV